MRHLLVTNDFPPKHGGIQSYLWELWRRLPPEEVTVLTAARAGAEPFDRAQPFRIVRARQRVLLPQPWLGRQIRALAADSGARTVLLDPALPLGAVGPSLGLPYGVVLHGAEVAVPARLPGTRSLLARVLQRASLVVAAGGYPMAVAERAAAGSRLPPIVPIPPGVDTQRFAPLPGSLAQAAVRTRWGLRPDARLVLSVSRLVPRKGMDVLIDAGDRLRSAHPDLQIAIAGSGRDRHRLETRIARTGAPVRLLGPIPDLDLPALYGAADIFALCCRDRWNGLEQEGFGIVLLEAAACALPAVAGRSGGAAEAVADGETGTVVDDPTDVGAVAAALDRLLADPELARRQGAAARARAAASFDYDKLATDLAAAIDGVATVGPVAGSTLAVRVRQGAEVVQEEVTERLVIAGTPEHCYAVLTDFERYPEWAADIKAVTVDERDADGRATTVTFRAAAFGRSTSYTLRYDYSGAPSRLSWVQVAGDLTRRLDGGYTIEPAGDHEADIRYDLLVELVVPLPGFVKRRAEGRIMGTALHELKARVESAAPEPPGARRA